MFKIKDILKVSFGVCVLGTMLTACSSHKLSMNGAVEDPIYTTQSDIKTFALKDAAAQKRQSLDNGASTEQGKQSGVDNSKYDYMPATSYGQRFNRMGNSFFLNDPYYSQNNYANQSSESRFSVAVQMGNGCSNMYNPYMNNYTYNPWRSGYNDPFSSYSMMQTNNYPFFTYNPYMFSYNYTYGYSSPWMMQNSFYDPYFYNPYYCGNAYGYAYGYNNPYRNTYRTSYIPSKTYISQRRNSSPGGTTSSSASSSTRAETSSYGNSNSNSTNNAGRMESGGGTRGGYDANNRTDRSSTTTHKGSTRR